MRFVTTLLASTLLFGACGKGLVIPQAPSEAKLGVLDASRNSQISAFSEATEFAINELPASLAKSAAFESNSVVRQLAGPATDKDRIAALKIVQKALAGKLDEARADAEVFKRKAEDTNAEIKTLKASIATERASFDAKLQAKIESEQKKWQTFIFMGGGAIFSVIGIAMLVMAGNPIVAASYAFLGPKAGWAALGAGLGLIAIGIALNAIERLIDNHPWIFGLSCALVAALVIISLTLTYGNHRHHVESSTANA